LDFYCLFTNALIYRLKVSHDGPFRAKPDAVEANRTDLRCIGQLDYRTGHFSTQMPHRVQCSFSTFLCGKRALVFSKLSWAI
jgi:hypothetical protein